MQRGNLPAACATCGVISPGAASCVLFFGPLHFACTPAVPLLLLHPLSVPLVTTTICAVAAPSPHTPALPSPAPHPLALHPHPHPQNLTSILKKPGVRKKPFLVRSVDDVLLCARNINSDSLAPIFLTSAVTGE